MKKHSKIEPLIMGRTSSKFPRAYVESSRIFSGNP